MNLYINANDSSSPISHCLKITLSHQLLSSCANINDAQISTAEVSVPTGIHIAHCCHSKSSCSEYWNTCCRANAARILRRLSRSSCCMPLPCQNHSIKGVVSLSPLLSIPKLLFYAIWPQNTATALTQFFKSQTESEPIDAPASLPVPQNLPNSLHNCTSAAHFD